MRLPHHTAFSALAAGTLFLVFKSWGMSLSCFIAGIFIDLDHIPDVVREHGWSVRIKDFFSICNNAQFERIVLFWHGWEWSVAWAVAAWYTGWHPWITGIFIGITLHLVLDTYANARSFSSYSLIWRWRHGFHFDTVFSTLKPLKYGNAGGISARTQS